MFQHRDAIGRGKGHSPARTAFADNHGHHRHTDLQALFCRACNGFGLSTFFGAFARISTGRVDKSDHRQAKTVCHIHQPDRFAIAFGAGHAKIARDA